ncbi:MAG: hypothetical protein DYG83_06040 [Candidatus Brocadia sp. AMX2]|uniref:Uncharacterized protein n=1 Tax=Candidatus Brocadia sinica JPN1 TaxID=1197129 RepID=A0ABQ0K0D9_9BACT|nr:MULTISPECIES: hypothetical protein [Brocadia]MBC6932189.1 hypothetical protein [Candidatus Brocadia sp.]MBL1169458.1 hypothetical protein [Candidatus Brocadia sp. AMX1]NOG42234.1 hypothetical protein [Planctomycetota bacterium]GIK11449.1 MAG: hypothetical protein BroJett002_01560 [Candidatus Brocadia sinica]KAA0245035.1 MAG: hypothetical protein EDM70_04565 [Candidatus Brocadia sp. AMX2]
MIFYLNILSSFWGTLYTDKNIHYIKGDIAEPWHAGTTNIYAVTKGIEGIDAVVPRDRTPIDITAYSPIEYLKEQLKAQVKYYKTPEATVKAISNPKYDGLIKIVPSDQLEAVKEAAYQLYLKNLQTRPEMANQYLHTYQAATDRLSLENAHSTPLSEKEALAIAKEIIKDKFDPERHGLNTLNFISWSDIARQSGEAALNAAVITAVLKSAPHLWTTLKTFLDEGRVNKESLQKLGFSTLKGSSEGALRGGISAALTASCKAGLLGEAFKNVAPTVIAAATVVALNTMRNSIALYEGKLSPGQFAETCIRDVFVISCGVLGASTFQTIIPIPLLGALVGNFIGSTCAVLIFEGSKSVFLSFFIESGISFFNIVKQDYIIPREILERCGFDLIQIDKIELDTIELDTIKLDKLNLSTSKTEGIDITLLKRGLINVNTIGYVY